MSSKKIIVFDTSIVLCWLKVPGKDTCGPKGNEWNHEKVSSLINEFNDKAIFVLPMATLIETGNHIAQCKGDRFKLATDFSEKIIKLCADAKAPWAAFIEQHELWSSSSLLELSETWPELAKSGLTLGDATIKNVAERYASAGYDVEILTGDAGLKSYEPAKPVAIPRRRSHLK